MSLVSSIIHNQHLDSLRNVGYIEMHAKPEYLARILSDLRFAHPDLMLVENVGPDCNGQIIFLRSHREHIRARLSNELARHQSAAIHTSRALAGL